MTKLEDHELLAEFARSESEEAFATLVARHVNLVYSAALRFTGNPHHAQEITQAVFIILARKAGSLRRGTVLSGWLYQTARLTAANFVRGEIRRQRREQEAYMQSTMNEPDAAAWQQIAPLLDEAMGRLGETDRNAVVLRFFESKTAQEVGAALQLTEAAAHKRVTRALEKLRKIFSQRGVMLTATLIAGAVTANSVQAAPAGVAASVVTAAKGTTATPSTQALVQAALKLMAWAKLKFALGLGLALLLVSVATTLTISQLRQSNPPARRMVVPFLPPASSALIIVGLTSADAPEQIETLAGETRRLLIQRGLPESHVAMLSGTVTRDLILQKLRDMARSTGDEFWLVLFGHSGITQGGIPAFQVSGVRLTADDLKLALDGIPGRQYVFIGTGGAGAFLPVLQDGRRTVLSATRAEGEMDQPRFLSAWVREFSSDPKAPFAAIAARASARVDAEYVRSNMAQSEHAQITDPVSGRILDAPFGITPAAPVSPEKP